MKKLFNSIFVIIAAMIAFVGCLKENIVAPEAKTIHFIAESIETKTAFGTPDGTTYPTLWTENDAKVSLCLNLKDAKTYKVTPSNDFKTAVFEPEDDKDESKFTDDQSGSYTFYSVSPSTANIQYNSNYKSFNLEVPTTQTPSETSVDERAQILVATSQTYAIFPDVVNFAFKHLTAYGKMSLTNLNLNGATISSVSLTASKNFAYRYYFYPQTGVLSENGSTKTITINTSSTTDIWFACAPVDLSNETLTVVVNTNKGTFTKTVTLPAERKFESGKIAKFAVNMSGVNIVAPDVYELVTDPASLTPESKVIICGTTGGNTYAMAGDKGNNRNAAAVTLSADNHFVSSPGPDVEIFTIKEGLAAGTVAFNTISGKYIYAASSSSNYLKTKDNLDLNGSWSVTITDGVTSVVANGDYTRNTMRFNPNNGSPMFASYASTSTTGSAVSLYKLQGSGTSLENYLRVSPAAIDVKADETSATFTVSSDLEWTATPSAGATVTTEGNTVTVSFAANTEESEKTYTVTVSANGVEPQTVTITQAKKIAKTQLTVAEFKELSDDDELYELTGEITQIYQAYDSGYNNISFYLEDDTGEILIFRMSCAGIDYTKVIVGNKITVKGKKTIYNDSAQMAAGGTCMSLVEVVTPAPTITFSQNIVAITAVEGADIYFTIDGSEPTINDDNFYDEPYEIEETCTIKAIAVKEGLQTSQVVEKYCELKTEGDNSNTYVFESKDLTPAVSYNSGKVNDKVAYKLGSSSNTGTLTFPAGYSEITLYAVGWTSGTNNMSVSNGKIGERTSVTLTNDNIASGSISNGFTKSFNESDDYKYTIRVTDSSQSVVVSLKRGIIWGFEGVPAN